jgi:peptidoglycan hydrolase-like protein with peptidoglycan-binding domain
VTTIDDPRTVPPVTDAEPEEDEPGRRRRGPVRLALGGVLLAAAGAGVWLWASNTSTEPAPATAGPAATAVVERGTIAATDSWDGTVDRGTPFTVTSSTEGMITRIAEQGATIARGDELYRVNEQPVILLRGSVPMYRDLGPGDSGADVNQLEANLAALGYDGLAVDGDYTESTAAAVRAWQEDIGVEPTGTVARGDVAFVPQGGRVDALRADVGDFVAPGMPILDLTGTAQVVSLEADVDDRDRFEVDTEVTVVLPGGDEVAGTVSATAIVEVRLEGPDDTDTESIVEIEVALDEQLPEEFLDAPVEVVVAIDERADVLLVPVNALLALAEGGFGLEVVGDDGTTSMVPVETGLFAEGKLEIRSDEVAEGTVVGVAGR